jgi:hypothetical protein
MKEVVPFSLPLILALVVYGLFRAAERTRDTPLLKMVSQ